MHSLRGLLADEVYFCKRMDVDLFHKIIEKGELECQNMFTLEETFDDSTKRCVRDKENIYFYFKLYEDHFFYYDDIQINFPIVKVVNKKIFINFLDDANYYFNQILK